MIRTLLFDLDGTLIDTNELIIATFLHVLEGKTAEPFTRDHIIPNMGLPLMEQLLMFTGRTEVEDLVQAYREYNVRMHDELVREFPHVREVVAALHEQGIRMGVVTNKISRTAQMGLKVAGLENYMDVIVAEDDVMNGKPDPEGILKAIEALGAEPETTVMVGDSQYDLQAAKRAGVRSAGVAWSSKGEEFLRQFEPDFLLTDMRDLYEIIGTERDAR
ncbi:pyrophosphatase PpaX [Paenibacillus sp. J31TS4]|uniref:pyrophosphatase PpaX n=1 Tax=Paenibacillus sp. J31TS4 TaxID=2807195 RepID=UPI001B1A9448|nr:pyrophosphatase PpaX [Paenibacillus sp. J31TS4]GIP40282.1 pyrophosphatase PpaX [Paenibacillus sp. J31TS4]